MNTKSSGVYQIRNIANGKCYVGRSRNLQRRKLEHFRKLRLQTHINRKLQNAFNLYGEDGLVFEVIEVCGVDDLVSREQHYINLMGAVTEGYNISPLSSDGGDIYSTLDQSIKDRIASDNRTRFNRMSDTEKNSLITSLTIGRNLYYSVDQNRVNHSAKIKSSCSNRTQEQLDTMAKNYSDASKLVWLNTSEEQRQLRCENISKSLVGKRTGHTNPRSRKCQVDDVCFQCVKDAREYLGLTYKVMHNRLHSDKYQNYIFLE